MGSPFSRASFCAARYALASFSRFRTSSIFHSSMSSLSMHVGRTTDERERLLFSLLRSRVLSRSLSASRSRLRRRVVDRLRSRGS